MKNADKPAMPQSNAVISNVNILPVDCIGLTKLEYFSVRIMAGFAVDPDIDAVMAQEVAKSAVMLADALLAELEARK